MRMNGCFICGQIAGDREHDLVSHLLQEACYVRRIAFETASFAVIPSLGPVVPGHTLLCPRRHMCAMRDVPISVGEEFEEAKAHVIRCLADRYGSGVHCFEHGSAEGTGRVLCSVGHAHVHFVPADVDVVPLLQDGLRWVPVGRSIEELRKAVGGREYLHYETRKRESMVAVVEDAPFESQYLRRVFATAVGRPEAWNWRVDPRPEEVHETFLALRETLGRAWCGRRFSEGAVLDHEEGEVVDSLGAAVMGLARGDGRLG